MRFLIAVLMALFAWRGRRKRGEGIDLGNGFWLETWYRSARAIGSATTIVQTRYDYVLWHEKRRLGRRESTRRVGPPTGSTSCPSISTDRRLDLGGCPACGTTLEAARPNDHWCETEPLTVR